jgi:hypothetical protein
VTEFLILKALALRPGVVKSRDQLMDVAYDDEVYVDDRTIDSHIKRIRKKFRAVDPEFGSIETLYGVAVANQNFSYYITLPDGTKDYVYKSALAGIVAYMKANPNKLSFGSPGIGTSVHVSGELFKSLTGTTMEHVPYKGRQFAIPDLIGGSIQVMFDNMPSALPMAKEGKIRALAQTTATRSPAAPDVPTVAESVPGFEATTWFAMFAPANVPRPVIDKLNAEVLRVFKLPEVQERLKTLGLDPVLSSPAELARYQATEITKWAKVVKDSGAKAQ